MKRFFILSLFPLMSIIHSCSTASPEMQKLQARQEVLKENKKLNDLRIDFEKEKQNQIGLQKVADKYIKQATNKTSDFSGGNNPTDAAKNASNAQKTLRKAQKANEELAASNSKLNKIQSKIDKTQSEIDQLTKKIEFVELNQDENE